MFGRALKVLKVNAERIKAVLADKVEAAINGFNSLNHSIYKASLPI